mgnify:CR=1 FL=1
MSYKFKLLGSFAVIFCIGAAVLVTVEIGSERNWKRSVLQSRLESYTDIINAAGDSTASIRELLPDDIRITILAEDGTVTYDSYEPLTALDNHLERPEIQDALMSGDGYAIRQSDTANRKYLYFAKGYDRCIIRAALPFEVDMEKYFRPDWVLLVGIVLLFAVLMLLARLFSRNYENRLRKASEDAAKELKHSLTSNIAHELKTPVSSIRGYLETIMSNPDISEDKRNQFIERSYSQSIRLSELIRDVALITKLEEAPEQFRIEPVDLCNIVTEVKDEFETALNKEEMQLFSHVPDKTMMNGNRSLLYAVLRNLVENSLKYAGKGAEIHIEASRHVDHLELCYYDNGAGVSESQLERIFERFYSIPGKPGATEGSGLGLSIVRNAVAFHKGTIAASNRKEGGLLFDMKFYR